jgi:hypothetical protein
LEGSARDLILRHDPRICLEGQRKSTKTLSRDSRSPGLDFNSGASECEAGELTTRPRCSVISMLFESNILDFEEMYLHLSVYFLCLSPSVLCLLHDAIFDSHVMDSSRDGAFMLAVLARLTF